MPKYPRKVACGNCRSKRLSCVGGSRDPNNPRACQRCTSHGERCDIRLPTESENNEYKRRRAATAEGTRQHYAEMQQVDEDVLLKLTRLRSRQLEEALTQTVPPEDLSHAHQETPESPSPTTASPPQESQHSDSLNANHSENAAPSIPFECEVPVQSMQTIIEALPPAIVEHSCHWASPYSSPLAMKNRKFSHLDAEQSLESISDAIAHFIESQTGHNLSSMNEPDPFLVPQSNFEQEFSAWINV